MSEIFRQVRTDAARSEPADARIARLHRYYVARFMCQGRDVLDLAPGDGSGAAIVGQLARSVQALAPGEKWPTEAAFDVVLAFEDRGRCAAPGALAALRGLLRPGGRLLIGTPDRELAPPLLGAAETGRLALNRTELLDLVRRHFAHAVLLGQRGLIGSAMLGAGSAAPRVIEHRGWTQAEAGIGLTRAPALFCVASDAALDDVTDSLFIDSDLAALAEAQDQALQATAERDALRTELTTLQAAATQSRRTDADWRHQLAVLRVNEAAAVAREQAARTRFEAAERTMFNTLAETERHYLAVLDRMQPRQPPSLTQKLRRRLAALRGGGSRAAAVRASALFDAAWYRERYPDVAAAGIDPATHYVRSGAAEGRDPGPAFDTAWYRAQHQEADFAQLSALEHFERHGRPAGWPTRPPPDVQQAASNPRVLFVSGESDTPGSRYRCVRYAEAARAAGWTAGWRPVEHTGAIELAGVEIVVLWRVRYSPHVAGIMREVRRQGGAVVFDLDDLMIRPELAATRYIDGIRTTNAGLASTRETFGQVRQAMAEADLCSAATEELAVHMRAWQKAVYVLPNGFDDAAHAAARLAVRRRRAGPSDHLVRIGYAAGTTTHQRDFAVALPGLLHVLQTRPQVRLVLFRAPFGADLVVIDEFDALMPYADRIEWRASVDLDDLPSELARFDINIAPLEVGNPFCEAKSELKYFEAALVDVPTVASPTGPFARAIVHGRTGLLAEHDEAWGTELLRLVDDTEHRRAIARAAYHDCLWRFGPRRRAELTHAFLEQVSGSTAGARAFALQLHTDRDCNNPDRRGLSITLPPADIVFHHDALGTADVTVIVPCYNYADYVIEALESVRAQTLAALDLVVIDDCSTDPLTTELIDVWVQRHATRFNRLLVLRHRDNAGLAAARNTGFDAAETPFILPLDADNRLRPECCASLLDHLRHTDAAYAYPAIRMFGAADTVFSNARYQPTLFIGGNYIDAMALVAKWAWALAGGYDMPRAMGWEDFDLWCKLAEQAQRGLQVDQVLADYRVHGSSMLAATVEVDTTKQQMVALLEQRHSWLNLSSRTPHDRI